MAKLIKYLLFTVSGVLVILVAIAAYIAATFDPNQYKPQIIELVKTKQQRTLKIDGDIKLAFFPSIGVNLPKLWLSEHKSDKEFAAVESARVSLKLLPLLSKQVVVDEVEVKGLRATIIRHQDGKTNLDDLTGAGEAKPEAKAGTKPATPPVFDIAHVDITNTMLNYTDEGSGAKYTLRDVNVKTGRIANATPGQIEVAFKVAGNQPKFDLDTHLKTRLTFDLSSQNYLLEALELAVKGEAAGISKLALNASGGVGAKLQSGEFSVEKLKVTVTGVKDKDNLDVNLEAPKLNLAADKFSGGKVTLLAKVSGQNNATVNLSLPALEGTQQSFKTGAINLELDAKQGEQSLKAKLSTPLTGNFKNKQFNLPALAANFSASGPTLPNKSVAGELKGAVSIDAAKEQVQAHLAGKLDESNLKAKVGVAGFAKPAINFDVDIDKLDADRYLPPKTAQAAQPAESKPAAANQAEKPIDLSALKNLNAKGSLRVGDLKVANVKAAQVRVDLKAANGRADIAPLSANLYQGSVAGSIGINAVSTPAFTVKQNLKGINIGPLLKDAAGYDALEGKGSVTLDVATQGATVSALKKALNGNAALNLADGALKGINIGETIRNFKSKLGALKGQQTQAADKSQQTDFSELKASFVIKNGVAHNDDLSMKSPLLRLSGNGDINVGEDSLNYLAKASIVASAKGQGGTDLSSLKGVTIPVRVSGPFKSPSYNLDFGGAVTEVVKQKAEEAVKSKVQDKLKGLFK